MNPQGERWTTDQVLALAPDEASRKAGGRLAAPEPWSETGADGAAVWGQCKGSGKKPYRTVIDLNGPAFTCSCPSRKFPCKHALGLLLLWAGGDGDRAVAAGEPAPWAVEWLAGRRERAGRTAGAAPGGGAASRAPADPEAAERRAARRMQRIGAGAMELEQRLEDLLQSGLASAGRAGGGDAHGGGSGSAGGSWDETAARMVDAQAPGLAARVRELGSVVASGADWPARLLEECALLHLLDQGFLGLDRLPAPLAATVRSRVGLTTEAAELLTGPDAATVRDRWLVLAQQDSNDGKLLTRRIFLRGERTGRMALHLSFGGSHRPLDLALPPGLVLDADLAYYPGARPLRAALGERHAPAAPGPVPPGCGIDAALTAYGDALRDDPWLDSWPVVLTDVTPIPGRDGAAWQLADADGESALPLDPRSSGRASRWQLAAISGGAPVTVFGECGHRGFLPLTVWDPTPVPL
ncbi:SWIM zinc finger protein [Streptomyces sp. 2333.5]|uniref:SWIM zinc finger family protein n=1 Tax=unclassified Streptomyces TaxID=2593676 RepID=UPI0008964703|nr:MULTISPECIES: SWIM zinc finger family protein [unclassified Streptomyces]PJJ03909.1 SWIM zinc finger protein [Streptomyces sp. 2333.5]SEE35912.1 SWIM zinc finger [Streptomyces sp. 2314.4]SEE62433.1 SWIM zinc finger [Streptomyces sp. 2112.2]